jgi:gentisate 1,2-dioxygenase
MAANSDSGGEAIAAFDAELAGQNIEGHWRLGNSLTAEPAVLGRPYLWSWDTVYGQLLRAGELLGMDGGASRRTLRLCTPGLAQKFTTPTFQTSIQLVKPGEIAEAHRHTMTAFRFILKGSGGFTNVEGEKFIMEPHDLVLTPQWTWHDHGNDTDEAMVWIDGLDHPLIQGLNACFFEPHNALQQDTPRPPGYHNFRAGAMRPAGAETPSGGMPYIYKGADALAALEQLGPEDHDRFDGLTLEYVNPVTGGPALATIACRLHLLGPGEATARRRHTANSVYHVVEGRGETEAGDERLAWGPGDTFVIPSWAWHAHKVAGDGRAVFFSIRDDPVFGAFGLYRYESQS